MIIGDGCMIVAFGDTDHRILLKHSVEMDNF